MNIDDMNASAGAGIRDFEGDATLGERNVLSIRVDSFIDIDTYPRRSLS